MLGEFLRENQPPNFLVALKWERFPAPEPEEPSVKGMPRIEKQKGYNICINMATEGTQPIPWGYQASERVPVLRGNGHCPHCLCAPCVVQQPPDFLRGCCGAHPANDEKRYRLYRLWWRSLKDLGVWKDEEYLTRKAQRTVRHDRREIIPSCVIKVRN